MIGFATLYVLRMKRKKDKWVLGLMVVNCKIGYGVGNVCLEIQLIKKVYVVMITN